MTMKLHMDNTDEPIVIDSKNIQIKNMLTITYPCPCIQDPVTKLWHPVSRIKYVEVTET